jgi:hypothetical protein
MQRLFFTNAAFCQIRAGRVLAQAGVATLGRFATKAPTLGSPLAGSGATLGACAGNRACDRKRRQRPGAQEMVFLILAAFGFACRHPIHFLRRLRQPASELIAGRGSNSSIPGVLAVSWARRIDGTGPGCTLGRRPDRANDKPRPSALDPASSTQAGMNRHSVNPVVVKKQLHIGSLGLDHLPWLSGGDHARQNPH